MIIEISARLSLITDRLEFDTILDLGMFQGI